MDIVQDTKPDDLYPMITTLNAKSRFSVIDILQKATGQQVTSFIIEKNGHIRPATFADKELIKVSEMVKAMDNGQLVYTISQIMESMTSEIESIAKSERAFSDNHDLLHRHSPRHHINSESPLRKDQILQVLRFRVPKTCDIFFTKLKSTGFFMKVTQADSWQSPNS